MLALIKLRKEKKIPPAMQAPRAYQIAWHKRGLAAFIGSLLLHVILLSPLYVGYIFSPTLQSKPPLFAITFKIVPLGNSLEMADKSSQQKKEEKKVSDFGLEKAQSQKEKSMGSSEGDVQSDAVFIHENYEEIVATVHNALIYPMLARARLWQGEVTISFTITPDGKVIDINIEKTSGYSILDESAVKTVQSMKGFPWPPYPVRLQIPIEYRLEK